MKKTLAGMWPAGLTALAVVTAVARPCASSVESSFRRTPPGASLVAFGFSRTPSDAESASSQKSSAQEERLYQRGTKALDERRWEVAIEEFGKVIAINGSRVDGAMYWTAWAQDKQGNRAEALVTLDQLRKSHPNSRWANEARALETEIRQASGQTVRPENEPDEDLKLMALNSLMNSDAERAIPMLEKFLQGSDSPKLKERALFVLAQSGASAAREVLAGVARGTRNPDLQEKALQYLGIFGGRENRQLLQEIYTSSSTVDVKRRILRSFMVAGERDRLLAVAKGEQEPELRSEAVRQLGVMGAHNELWQLYQAEPAAGVKNQIIRAMFVGGSADRLIELARTEKDPELRRTAVRNLGLIGSSRTGEALVSIYSSDKDPAIRKAVIDALFVQNNARALVELARKETDIEMKRQIISKLSLMRSKEATDYLMELLIK